MSSSDSRPSNRRNFERERVAFTAVVWLAPDDPAVQANASAQSVFRVCYINNLSMSGLSFQNHEAFAIDTVLWIRIRMGSKTCQFKGIVRRASTHVVGDRRGYVTGVQFVRSHQTTHAQAIVAGYFDTCRRRARDTAAYA